jgi:hypothetical protein
MAVIITAEPHMMTANGIMVGTGIRHLELRLRLPTPQPGAQFRFSARSELSGSDLRCGETSDEQPHRADGRAPAAEKLPVTYAAFGALKRAMPRKDRLKRTRHSQ